MPTRRDELMAAALSYATRGWPVFAVHSIVAGRCTCGAACGRDAGKHPRTRRGVTDATTDEATIRRWWTWWPDTNIGAATGAVSGMWVLDVDDEDSLADLERQHGGLPDTVTALTGRGGRHVMFKAASIVIGNKVGVVPGIDVRGDGGYVILPPSLHLTGRRYTWQLGFAPNEIDLAAAPASLVELVTTSGTRAGRLKRDGTPLLINDGERNDTLMRLGCALRRYGLAQRVIEVALLAANREHCKPALDEHEVRRIAASVARYPAGETDRDPRRVSLKVV